MNDVTYRILSANGKVWTGFDFSGNPNHAKVYSDKSSVKSSALSLVKDGYSITIQEISWSVSK